LKNCLCRLSSFVTTNSAHSTWLSHILNPKLEKIYVIYQQNVEYEDKRGPYNGFNGDAYVDDNVKDGKDLDDDDEDEIEEHEELRM